MAKRCPWARASSSRSWRSTLEILAKEGVEPFYTGQHREAAGGRRAEDGRHLDAGRSRGLQAPSSASRVVGHYRGATIISAPPPTSGGVALIEALNILAGYDLEQVDAVTRKHLIIEAMRRMHRDRAVYLGDPAFVAVPVQRLTDPDYAAGLRTSIRLDRATPSAALESAPEAHAGGTNTTHFSVLDKDGNRVAGTITLNAGFGSGLMVDGTGMLLNNQMDDFSIKPGVPNIYGLIGASANAIAPGKRMLSSITPTFVESPRGFMIVGSPGGSLITGMVLLATLDWMDGMSAQQIVAAPRIHHQYQPDMLVHEAQRADGRGSRRAQAARPRAARARDLGQPAGGHLRRRHRQGQRRFGSARRGDCRPLLRRVRNAQLRERFPF